MGALPVRCLASTTTRDTAYVPYQTKGYGITHAQAHRDVTFTGLRTEWRYKLGCTRSAECFPRSSAGIDRQWLPANRLAHFQKYNRIHQILPENAGAGLLEYLLLWQCRYNMCD